MSKSQKNSIRIAALFLLLLVPTLYAMHSAIDLEYSWLKKTAYLGAVVLLLLIPALFLKARAYFIAEGVLNFLFFPIDIASLYLNKQSTSTAFLENILHTDIHEATELLLSMWPLCMIVVALWGVYFVLAIRVDNRYLLTPLMRKIVWIGVPVAGALGVTVMTVYIKHLHPERALLSVPRDAISLTWIKFYKIYPYNLYIESIDIIRKEQEQKHLQEQLATFSFGIRRQESSAPAMYVLVIGEASRYDHWSINGYQRQTTPLLANLPNLISYDSAFSQANLTQYSVPLIITRATADNPYLAYAEKSLPEAFQEAGIKAGFLTTQIPSDLTNRIMNACDCSYFNHKGIDVENNYDEQLVQQLSSFTTDSTQFFVLHSLGCHFRYELRYPQSFDIFQPTFGKSFSYSMVTEENKDKLINAYDNAIAYTDYFLHQLITYIDDLNRPAVVLYMSDHGESFWDDDRKLSLHGSYQLSEYEYHVPLLVWYSDEYATLNPDKVQALHNNRTKPLSSDVVFYTLLDLAGIREPVDSTRSLCSPDLASQDSILVHIGSGGTQWFHYK